MSDNGIQMRHRLAVLGSGLAVVAVAVIVFFVVNSAKQSDTGDAEQREQVEAVYHDYAMAVQSGDVASARVCTGRTEPTEKLAQTEGMLSGIGTAGSEVRVKLVSITVDGTTARVDGALNTMGTDVPLPAELRKVDGRWCVWA
ncbi:hypothetical protein [Gordonia neofelifaecis]|uniref:Uncharacterized protein n=1 Tax=Gordonia neofelifaecis NRRL B-59395 TaxID=644548 RepID=F1YJC4_9ACTN|nr:hypothetical protein [Gordonia neofelifaecis]EGD55157.1 hypothetical protein SCNU_09804 [Gordonia neofelifaecis NRRL B-59395]